MSKNMWGQIDQAGNSMQTGDYASLINQGKNAATAGGMYIPELPFNQQQQLQQLGFFDDVKNGAKKLAKTGRNVINQAG